MAYFDSFRSGTKVPLSGIYRVFHGQGHLEPHCVTMLAEAYFPRCLKCEGFVRYELIFDAPHAEEHEMFRVSDDR